MPRGKPYRKRSHNNHRRPGYVACGRMVYGDAQKALALATRLKGLVNVEFKFLDHIAVSTVSATPTIIQITNAAVGDTAETRDGDQVKLTSIYLNYIITLNASATASTMRVMLIKDSQTNGAIYTAAQLFADSTANDNLVSPLNLDNKYRFKVLYDRNHIVSSTGKSIIHLKKYIKVSDKIRYGGAAGDITDLNSASYSILAVSNEATNQPTFQRSFRVRFVDN